MSNIMYDISFHINKSKDELNNIIDLINNYCDNSGNPWILCSDRMPDDDTVVEGVLLVPRNYFKYDKHLALLKWDPTLDLPLSIGCGGWHDQVTGSVHSERMVTHWRKWDGWP